VFSPFIFCKEPRVTYLYKKKCINQEIRVKGGKFIVEMLIIVAAFAIIGGGLKYIDEAFDEEVFNQKLATAMACILLVLWIGISILDKASATILFSVLIGVLFTGKIDNSVFGASTAAIVGSLSFLQRVVFLPFLFLSITGIIDEKGNDYVDTHESNKIIEFFFLHRFTMKIGIFALSLAGFFSIVYFLAFIFFDIAYDTIGFISSHYQEELPIEMREGKDNLLHASA
jgi:hypothetical protein